MSLAELRTDLVIVACAASAGIHVALAPSHLAESTGMGLGFGVAALLLATLAVALTRNPGSAVALAGAAALFVGLLAGYALAITTGLAVVHPDPEPVDGLALSTKAVEAVGLLAALHGLRRSRPVAAMNLRMKGTS